MALIYKLHLWQQGLCLFKCINHKSANVSQGQTLTLTVLRLAFSKDSLRPYTPYILTQVFLLILPDQTSSQDHECDQDFVAWKKADPFFDSYQIWESL